MMLSELEQIAEEVTIGFKIYLKYHSDFSYMEYLHSICFIYASTKNEVEI